MFIFHEVVHVIHFFLVFIDILSSSVIQGNFCLSAQAYFIFILYSNLRIVEMEIYLTKR